MTFTALASSSAGNAYIVSDSKTRLLIEAGLAHKTLQTLLGFRIAELDGCLISHEHKDHAKAALEVIKDGIPVYMSEGTKEALNATGAAVCASMKQFSIGSMEVVPFAVFHDCAEPLGFLIQSRVDGDKLVFATDTVNLRYKFPGVNILAIEANFDPEILSRCEKMPEKTRHRIANTHMDINVLCEYLCTLDLSKCREIYLLHLSSATSHEGHFINKVRRIVPPNVAVTAACRGGKAR